MKLFARRALAFLFWSPVLFGAAGCNNQAEGERCDITNGNIDCNEGLTCKQVYVLGYHYICCPVPPARINVAACNAAGVPPPDGGTSAPDATSDVRSERSADTSAPDANGNDAVNEPTDERPAVDTTSEVSQDMSVDPSMPDISADRITADAQDGRDALDDVPSTPDQASDSPDDSPVDATSADTAPDGPADTASEVPPDAPDLDGMTPTDVADAPADGPG